MTDAEVFVAVADFIDLVGLHKGDVWPNAREGASYKLWDPCCVLGVFEIVVGDFYRSRPLIEKLRCFVNTGIAVWSDASSQEEVVRTFRELAHQ